MTWNFLSFFPQYPRTLVAVFCAASCAMLAGAPAFAKVPTEAGAQIPTPGSVTLLDVSSYYCVPCRALKPHIESLSKRYDEAGRAKVFLVDMEDDPSVVDRFHVDVTPTLIFFDKSGKEVGRLRGYQEEADIAAQLDKLL